MFICQLGMHNNVQGHRNENVCKQTYDASCMQTYIEAMEHETQHAREQAGDGDIYEQPMIAVITAAGKMLLCAALPVF